MVLTGVAPSGIFSYASCVVVVVVVVDIVDIVNFSIHGFNWHCSRLLRFSYASYVVVHVRYPQALRSVPRV